MQIEMDVEKEMFSVNVKILTCLGMWDLTDSSRTKRAFYTWYKLLLNCSSVMLNVLTLVVVYNQIDTPLKALDNLDKSLVGCNSTLKVFFFFLNKKKLIELVDEIRRSGDIIAPQEEKKMNKLSYSLITAVTLTVCGFFVLSFIEGHFSYEIWLPFIPETYSWQWNLIYLFQMSMYLPNAMRMLAIEAFIGGLLLYLCEQLMILSDRLRSLKPGHNLQDGLKICIEKHIRIIGYSKRMKTLFQEILLVQNLAVTIELCLTAFMVSVVACKKGGVSRFVQFLCILMVTLINAYVYCYLGNELILKSQNAAQAAFESSWIDWPVANQKDLLMIIRCAQKPLFLTAGSIMILSLQTYSKIVSDGYSFFALLYDVVD